MNSNSHKAGLADLDFSRLPAHVAFIMDGNGRWAKKRIMNRVKGHEQGTETVRTMVTACRELHIPYLTLYAFSTENWSRSKVEVSALMSLLRSYLISERDSMVSRNIRLSAIGQLDRLPEKVRKELQATMEATRNNDGLQVNLALSYGGRDEITQMVRVLSQKVADRVLSPEDISEDIISKHLFTSGMPDPDLLIRTSGEMRLSNFLLWQLAYAEIYFTNTLWPDFSREEFVEILKDYQNRERRFGGVTES